MKKDQARKIAAAVNKGGKNIKTKKGKILYAVVLIVIAAVVFFAGDKIGIFEPEQPSTPPVSGSSVQECRVHFIDVGQGDCELVECGGKYMLIDAGENGHETEVLNYLHVLGVKKLDYVVASHQHSDHIGGLSEVLEEFDAENIIMPRLTKTQTPTNSTYKAFLNAVKESGAKVIEAKANASYQLGGASFCVLGPVTDDAEDINNMSAVIRLDFGKNSFLFTGDAETEEELEILNNNASVDCDVLKVGHHGSGTSSSKKFLEAVTPDICVISCGEGNDYGHPHDNAVKRLKKQTDEIYRTDICGDIVVSSDGKELSISYKNSEVK